MFETIPPRTVDEQIMSSLFARLREIKTQLRTTKMHVEDVRDAQTEIRQLKEVIEEEAARINANHPEQK